MIRDKINSRRFPRIESTLWNRLAYLVLLSLNACTWFSSSSEKPYYLLETWGEKGQAPGQFHDPIGIDTSDHEIFVSDARNARIQVFDHAGRFQRIIGNSGENQHQVSRPMGLDVVKDKIYVADYFKDQILVYTLSGKYLKSIGNKGSDPGQFNAPSGVAVANNGDIYVADFYNQRIQQLDPQGNFIRQWGKTGEAGTLANKFNYPIDVTVDAANYIYIADGYNDRIVVYSPTGSLYKKWGGPGAINFSGPYKGWFSTTTSVAIGPHGNVFVADFNNDRIQKFTSTGKFLNSFGIPSSGPRHTAIGVCVTPAGKVLVTDIEHHQILVWEQVL